MAEINLHAADRPEARREDPVEVEFEEMGTSRWVTIRHGRDEVVIFGVSGKPLTLKVRGATVTTVSESHPVDPTRRYDVHLLTGGAQ